MIAVFDGKDEYRQNIELAELRYKHGMSWDAAPLAIRVDDEWQVWWKDTRSSTWFYRESFKRIVQIPFDAV